MRANVCIIGHLGDDRPFYDGQTVKTRALVNALRCSGQEFKIYYADTYFCKTNIIKFFWTFCKGIFMCDRIILCVSKGGRRVFFPIGYILARAFHKKIYHFAIGGRLADEVQSRNRVKKQVIAFQKNWVESHALADQLSVLGVNNAEYLPNFKDLPVIHPEELPRHIHKPLRCVFFSRISEQKGASDAMEAVTELNHKRGQVVVTLDIFGKVEDDYKENFVKKLAKSGSAVHYHGAVSPNASVSILIGYDVLLFPTHYYREGIPGTIIDAFSSGLPVIARQWSYCDEIVKHGQTGYCYDFDKPELIQYWLEYALLHPMELLTMKQCCLDASKQYRVDHVVPIIVKELLHK